MKKKKAIVVKQPPAAQRQYNTRVLCPIGTDVSTGLLMLQVQITEFLDKPDGSTPVWLEIPTSVNQLAKDLSIPVWSGGLDINSDAELMSKISATLNINTPPQTFDLKLWVRAHGSVNDKVTEKSVKDLQTAKALNALYRFYPCILYAYEPFRRMVEWQEREARYSMQRQEQGDAVKWLAKVYHQPAMSQTRATERARNAVSYPLSPVMQNIWLRVYGDVVLMHEVWLLLQDKIRGDVEQERRFEEIFSEIKCPQFNREWVDKIKSKDKPIDVAGIILDACIARNTNSTPLKSRKTMRRQIVQKIKQRNAKIIGNVMKCSQKTAKAIVGKFIKQMRKAQ